MAENSRNDAPRSIRGTLRAIRFAIVTVAVVSLGINLLMLVAPLYLMQVFDRVLTSGNLHTLFWLTVVAVGSLAVYGTLEVMRGRLLSKVGIWLECKVTEPLIKAGLARARADGGRGRAQPLRDLAQVRGFLSGPAVCTLFDAPWALMFLALLWVLHPWFGMLATASAGVLIVLAVVTEARTRRLSRTAGESQTAALGEAEAALRNAESVHAMGMTGAILDRWNTAQAQTGRQQDTFNDKVALFSGTSKFLRMAVQISILGIGAVLVVDGAATPGTMIAASILLGRALAPIDQAIGSWKQIAAARVAWRRVNETLATSPAEVPSVRLPTPEGRLEVEDASLVRGRQHEPLLENISFALAPGESLAVVGPSAAGKSTLCRMLTGILAPTTGHVRIDHAEVESWPEADLRPHVGYLPQEVDLFPGTVGDNIARLADESSRDIVAAARLAGVHELILRLPDGYQTDVGECGHLLSGGQRQRIGLARAVFGDPCLVVLDEPNSNLDPAGEAALMHALAELRARGCTVVVVSHKLGIVQNVDNALLLQDGAIQAFGPSAEVLSLLQGEAARPRPVAVGAAAAE